MTKKIFRDLLCKWNVLAIVLVAMFSFGFVSCGSDDKTDDPASIYGTWRRDSKSGAGYVLLKLNPDGTGIQEEHYDDDYWSHPTSFFFDEYEKCYYIYFYEREDPDPCRVQYFNETTMVLIFPGNEYKEFKRVN